jgi:sugar O-acyltransferase (sialic acid O-acetyltransferase NeuD family)
VAHVFKSCSARWGVSLIKKIRLLVVGAGGHGKSVAEAAELSDQFMVVGFLDDSISADEVVLGAVASVTDHREAADQAIVAIGNNAVREKVMQQVSAAGFGLASVIHPRAVVSPSATLGAGSTVMAGAIVGTEARLGMGTIINCGAVVDHHATVEDYGHLGVNASMAGFTVLGRGAWMQAGSALGYGVRVEAGRVLSPGSGRDRHQGG